MMTAEIQRYSQGHEQEAILECVKGIDHGRFLDIGAWNPKVFSNTRALYELGWSGVMIEPSPEPLRALVAEYGNDDRIVLIGAAVGFHHGLTQLHVTDDATSTTVPAHYEAWKGICKFVGTFQVPTITLGDIFNQFGAFDFVNIDAEGSSADLFREFLTNYGCRPKCICVEHDGREGELAALAGPLGYRMQFRNGENAVFTL